MTVVPFDKALKLTIKQERFACAYVETGNATAAYRQAYKALAMSAGAIRKEASRLLHHPAIIAEVTRLKRAVANRNEIDVDEITQKLRDTYDKAMANDQTSAAVMAAMGLAKLGGLLGEPVQEEPAPTIEELTRSIGETTREIAKYHPALGQQIANSLPKANG
jgi:phage terminase small subunit